MIPFEQLDDQAKLWSYQSDRLLTDTEVSWIQDQLKPFLLEWAAHGTKLKAYGDVLNHAHLILVVDESDHNASGCSIDASVRFIKQLENELGISFFNRLKMLAETDEGQRYISFAELDSLPKQAMVYNNMVNSVGAFRNSWKVNPDFFVSAQ